jgi:hypothetical protein
MELSHCQFCNTLVDYDGYEDKPPRLYHGENQCRERLRTALAEERAKREEAHAHEAMRVTYRHYYDFDPARIDVGAQGESIREYVDACHDDDVCLTRERDSERARADRAEKERDEARQKADDAKLAGRLLREQRVDEIRRAKESALREAAEREAASQMGHQSMHAAWCKAQEERDEAYRRTEAAGHELDRVLTEANQVAKERDSERARADRAEKERDEARAALAAELPAAWREDLASLQSSMERETARADRAEAELRRVYLAVRNQDVRNQPADVRDLSRIVIDEVGELRRWVDEAEQKAARQLAAANESEAKLCEAEKKIDHAEAALAELAMAEMGTKHGTAIIMQFTEKYVHVRTDLTAARAALATARSEDTLGMTRPVNGAEYTFTPKGFSTLKIVDPVLHAKIDEIIDKMVYAPPAGGGSAEKLASERAEAKLAELLDATKADAWGYAARAQDRADRAEAKLAKCDAWARGLDESVRQQGAQIYEWKERADRAEAALAAARSEALQSALDACREVVRQYEQSPAGGEYTDGKESGARACFEAVEALTHYTTKAP